VRLGDAVKNAQSVFAGTHEVGRAQRHEMLRDGCLAFAKHGLDVTDADFTRAEELQDVETGRVRQGAQELSLRFKRWMGMVHGYLKKHSAN
jgi:hypothetical protein